MASCYARNGLNPERTLFIDDSEPILDAATKFGIGYCLGRHEPGFRHRRKKAIYAIRE